MLYYTTPISLVCSTSMWLICDRLFPPKAAAAPVAHVMEPHAPEDATLEASVAKALASFPAPYVALSCVLAMTTQLLSTLVASICSSLMYAVLSQAKTVATMLLGAYVFASEFSSSQGVSSTLCLLGSMCYAFLDATAGDKAAGIGESTLQFRTVQMPRVVIFLLACCGFEFFMRVTGMDTGISAIVNA